MKKILFSLSLLALLAGTFSSCKKGGEDDGDREPEECERTVANIAGRYKLVACKLVTASGEVDYTSTIYEPCELDDINELKADGTFVYNDAGTVCSPSGSTSGTWRVNDRTLQLNSGFSNIESFDCTNLVVTFRYDDDLIKETYRKQ